MADTTFFPKFPENSDEIECIRNSSQTEKKRRLGQLVAKFSFVYSQLVADDLFATTLIIT
jgi:hypothetical protein